MLPLPLKEGLVMQSYSQDLRDRVLRALERGDGPTDIAARFEVSREWVYDVKKRFETEGLRHSLRVGGHRVSCVAPLESEIRGWIQARPDLTLEELCERVAERGVYIKVPALWHQLNQWNLSFKKNAARQRARARRREEGAGAVERKSASTRRHQAGIP
jgi:transposase